PVWPVLAADLERWLGGRSDAQARWARAAGFTGQAGRVLAVPGEDGGCAGFLFGLGDDGDGLAYGALSDALPPGRYRIEGETDDAARAAFGFALGAYRFGRYRGDGRNDLPVLVLPEAIDAAELERAVEAAFLVRDLVN